MLDDLSRAIADARAALALGDQAAAATAMARAASSLQTQTAKAVALDHERAAADVKRAHETRERLVRVQKQLAAAAAQVKSGRIVSIAALDRALDATARADLERRWLVTDAATWFPVVGAPQQHFTAAAGAYAAKDSVTAAEEVRKADAFIRLEAARAAGDVKEELDSAGTDLNLLARDLDNSSVKSGTVLSQRFSRALYALAHSHQAKAREDWAHQAYTDAGHELKAAARSTENAASWIGAHAIADAREAVSEGGALGDKLTGGGVWTRHEAAKGFDDLGAALRRLKQEEEAGSS